jgi:hypothetical protein
MARHIKLVVIVFLLLVISQNCFLFAQKSARVNKKFTIYGMIFSLKGGISSGDKFLGDNKVDYLSFNIPVGPIGEFTVEYPIGNKGFYGALNVNGWYSKDKFYDNVTSSDVNRKAYGLNFCTLIKYRYLLERTSFDLSAGIGRSLAITKYTQIQFNYNTDMTNICANAGVDFFLDNGLLFTAEGSYYYLFGGYDTQRGDRTNSMFLGKLGIGYVFPLKQRK